MSNTKNSYYPKGLNSVGILPILASGMVDASNPAAILGLIFCMSVLLSLGRSSLKIIIVGMSLTFFVYLITFFSVLGAFDSYFGSVRVGALLQYIYVVIAGCLIVLGMLNLYDWVQLRREKQPKRLLFAWPKLFFDQEIGENDSKPINLFDFFALVLLGAACGFIIAVLESIWPPHYNIATLVIDIQMPGKRMFAYLALCLYTLMYVFPLVVTTFLMSFIVMNDQFVLSMRSVLTKVKIIVAGIFMGLGGALLYIFF